MLERKNMLKAFLYIIFDIAFVIALSLSIFIMINIQFRLPTNWVFILYNVILALYMFILPKMLGVKWDMPLQNVGEGYRYLGGFVLILISVFYIFFY